LVKKGIGWPQNEHLFLTPTRHSLISPHSTQWVRTKIGLVDILHYTQKWFLTMPDKIAIDHDRTTPFYIREYNQRKPDAVLQELFQKMELLVRSRKEEKDLESVEVLKRLMSLDFEQYLDEFDIEEFISQKEKSKDLELASIISLYVNVARRCLSNFTHHELADSYCQLGNQTSKGLTK